MTGCISTTNTDFLLVDKGHIYFSGTLKYKGLSIRYICKYIHVI